MTDIELTKLVIVVFCLVAHGPAQATAILDTYPASGIPDGPDAGLFGDNTSGQEIAIPFSLVVPGTIISIDTGIQLRGGIVGWRLGVMSYASLYGSTTQHGGVPPDFSQFEYFVNLSTPASSPCNTIPTECHDIRFVNAGEFVMLSGLNWFLESGDYFLVAAWRYDMEGASWLTNASMLSDQWVIQAIGNTPYSSSEYPCGGGFDGGLFTDAPWITLAECGIAPQPTPVARISFEPDQRIPEPATIALIGLGLAGLYGVRSRKPSLSVNSSGPL